MRIICERSALNYLRLCNARLHAGMSHHTSCSLSDTSLDFDTPSLRDLSGYGFGESPIHLLVPTAGLRRKESHLTYHVHKHAMPQDSLIRLDHDTYVTTYPLIFAMLASNPEISVLELTLLAYEFCGYYTYVPYGTDGYTELGQPQSSVDELLSYIDKLKWCKGVRKAREALKIARDGSRSPMETLLALRILLPQRRGGLNVAEISLNKALQLNKVARGMTGLSEFHGDITVDNKRVDIEYHSREHHLENSKADYDALRGDVLKYLGYDVLVMTPAQFYSEKHFDSFARKLYKGVGKTYHQPSLEQLMRRQQLVDELEQAERTCKLLTPELYRDVK